MCTNLVCAMICIRKGIGKGRMAMRGYLDKNLDAMLITLQPHQHFRIAPTAAERQAWEQLDGQVRNQILFAADGLRGKPFSALSAVEHMEYARGGDGCRYRAAYEDRRERLGTLVLAECIAYDGRYMEDIVNLLWAVLEESSWALPESNLKPGGDGVLALPIPELPTIDRAAAHTASDLAWVWWLLGKKLDDLSPQIGNRIEYEVNRRIFIPLVNGDQFGWQRHPERQTAGCVAGCLSAVLLMVDAEDKRWQLIRRCMLLGDRLVARLPQDGSLPGGIGEWEDTAGELMDVFSLLFAASDGHVVLYDEPQVINMGRFAVFCHMQNQEFFTMQSVDSIPSGERLYRYGIKTRDARLCDLGAYIARMQGVDRQSRATKANLMNRVFHLFYEEEIRRHMGKPPQLGALYLPDARAMMSRSEADSERGFALWCSAGFEGGSKAGDICLSRNGRIILSAVQEAERGAYNLPLINGQDQRAAAFFSAEDVECDLSPTMDMITMNLAPTYPKQARVHTWQRTVMLSRGEDSIRIIEVFDFEQAENRVEFQFVFADEPRMLEDSSAQVQGVRLDWESSLVSRIEPVRFGERLQHTAFRLVLVGQRVPMHGSYTFLMQLDNQ